MRIKKRKSNSDQVSLQITSMADIFTILLVFLLKGLASDAITVTPSTQTRLPASVNARPLTESVLTFEINSQSILLDKNPTDSVRFKDDVENIRKKQIAISKVNEDVVQSEEVVILVSEEITVAEIEPYLNTLSEFGFTAQHFGVLSE